MGSGRGVVSLVAGGLVLSACSSAQQPDATPSLTSRLSSYFSTSKDVATPATAKPVAASVDCPGVEIRRGAGTLNVAAKGGGGQATAGDLRYQVSFGQLARECIVAAGTLTIKVGVQGRVIIGPQGGPGNVDVPLRYAVVKEGPDPKTIATKFKRVPVTLSGSETNVSFTDVDDSMTFQMPSTTELETYVIYVGFDEIGDKPERKPPAKSKQPARTQ